MNTSKVYKQCLIEHLYSHYSSDSANEVTLFLMKSIVMHLKYCKWILKMCLSSNKFWKRPTWVCIFRIGLCILKSKSLRITLRSINNACLNKKTLQDEIARLRNESSYIVGKLQVGKRSLRNYFHFKGFKSQHMV